MAGLLVNRVQNLQYLARGDVLNRGGQIWSILAYFREFSSISTYRGFEDSV